MKGLFITFEGIEGCGKTTQLKRAQRYLEESGHKVVVTREPGGTAVGEAIRDVLLDPLHVSLAPATELLLYAAARAQHVAEKIAPALEEGRIVLCDRFADSTTAYQGGGRGLSLEDIRMLHAIAVGGLAPDLTVLLDLSASAGLERARARGRYDRLEREAILFHERVRDAFLQLAAEAPERIKVVDGSQSVDEVAAAVQARLDALLRETCGAAGA
ncbi:MAG: dTMP kinase [Candidatus Hydrogenedentes bacterium]|nr:dTMP kinase [Candidatus Hydrogenedentota bacterium]